MLSLFSIVVLIVPGFFTPSTYILGGGPIIPLTILGLVIFAFALTLVIGKFEEATYGPYSTSQERVSSQSVSKIPRGTESATADSKSNLSLAKTSSGQLFWQTPESRKSVSKRDIQKVRAMRGGEIIGGRFKFKVKVLNESPYTINDVTVYILSYPRDTLILKTEDDDIFFSKIEPQGFRSPSFDFLPTQD